MLVARALGTQVVPVILNRGAGWLRGSSLDARTDQLARAFREAGLEPEVQLVPPSRLRRAVLAAQLRGAPAVFVGGGDGTLSTAASVLVGTRTALGVLPVGTRNHFAQDLGLPRDVVGTVRAAAAGHIAAIDVGEVNGRVFVNNLSLGIYPRAVADGARHHEHVGLPKGAALAFGLLGALWRLPRVRVSIRAPGHEDHPGCDAPFVFIGNNEYAFDAGFGFGRRGALDRGELAVYWAEGAGRVGMFRTGVRALLRRLDREPTFTKLLVPRVVLTSPRRTLEVALDGEVQRLRLPLRVRSRPGALRVVVPGGEDGEQPGGAPP